MQVEHHWNKPPLFGLLLFLLGSQAHETTPFVEPLRWRIYVCDEKAGSDLTTGVKSNQDSMIDQRPTNVHVVTLLKIGAHSDHGDLDAPIAAELNPLKLCPLLFATSQPDCIGSQPNVPGDGPLKDCRPSPRDPSGIKIGPQPGLDVVVAHLDGRIVLVTWPTTSEGLTRLGHFISLPVVEQRYDDRQVESRSCNGRSETRSSARFAASSTQREAVSSGSCMSWSRRSD